MRWGLRLVSAGSLIVSAILMASCGQSHSTAGRVQLAHAAQHSNAVDLPPVQRPVPHPDMVPVGNEAGDFVGYIHRSEFHVASLQRYYETVNARTLWPVTDWNDKLVGYVAPDVPFVPLSVAQESGFDIEKLRAARNGGCEDQIGDPTFKQEFPRCD